MKLKKLYYFILFLIYQSNINTKLSKMELKDRVRINKLTCAGMQYLKPKELIFDDTCIIRKRKLPKSRLEYFKKRAESVNVFKKFGVVPQMEIVKKKVVNL
jgi:hypothetical protein